jgi:hypothetical protein
MRSILLLPLAFGLLVTSSPASVQSDALPDRALTPGATLPVSTMQICTVGYTRTVRNVPASLKRAVYASYGRKPEPGVCCDGDSGEAERLFRKESERHSGMIPNTIGA